MSITGKIKTLFADKNKSEAIFPRTKISAITDDNGTNLSTILDNMATGGEVDLSGYVAKTGATMTGDLQMAAINAEETADISFARPSGHNYEAHIDVLEDSLRVYTWDKNGTYGQPLTLSLADGSLNTGYVRPTNPVEIVHGGTGATTLPDLLKVLCSNGSGNSSPGYVMGFNTDYKSSGYTSIANLRTTLNLSTMINGLSVGTDAPVDADYYVCQYANGAANNNTNYYRRPMSSMWQWIKSHDPNFSESVGVEIPKKINGEQVKTMMFKFGTLPNNTTKSVNINCPNQHIVDVYLIGFGSTSGRLRVFPCSAASDDVVSVYFQNGALYVQTWSNWSEYTAYAFVQYTMNPWMY